jgi:hypothetical protein
MSYKLETTPRFSAEVTAEIPGDNGRATKVKYHVWFKRPTTDKFDEMVERINAHKAGNATTANGLLAMSDQDVVDELLDGFGDDLFDDNGNALEFTSSNVKSLCAVFPMRPSIVSAFFDGFLKAKVKN